MSRSYAMTMKRPHVTLGLPIPVGRKIGEAGKTGWMVFLGAATFACIVAYIFLVNASATKAYELRGYEKRLERLKETVSVLENQTAEMQSMHALEQQVKSLGYVPVEQIEFIDAPRGFAMAK